MKKVYCLVFISLFSISMNIYDATGFLSSFFTEPSIKDTKRAEQKKLCLGELSNFFTAYSQDFDETKKCQYVLTKYSTVEPFYTELVALNNSGQQDQVSDTVVNGETSKTAAEKLKNIVTECVDYCQKQANFLDLKPQANNDGSSSGIYQKIYSGISTVQCYIEGGNHKKSALDNLWDECLSNIRSKELALVEKYKEIEQIREKYQDEHKYFVTTEDENETSIQAVKNGGENIINMLKETLNRAEKIIGKSYYWVYENSLNRSKNISLKMLIKKYEKLQEKILNIWDPFISYKMYLFLLKNLSFFDKDLLKNELFPYLHKTKENLNKEADDHYWNTSSIVPIVKNNKFKTQSFLPKSKNKENLLLQDQLKNKPKLKKK